MRNHQLKLNRFDQNHQYQKHLRTFVRHHSRHFIYKRTKYNQILAQIPETFYQLSNVNLRFSASEFEILAITFSKKPFGCIMIQMVNLVILRIYINRLCALIYKVSKFSCF